MSYQKQKANLTKNTCQSDPADSAQGQCRALKKKRIQKEFDREEESSEAQYSNLSKKKKQVAKEIKRIRQQNRRATHKQYVTNLQQQIKEKQVQIQKLSARIKQLQLELQAKLCHKCGNDLTVVGSHSSPISVSQPDSNFIDVENVRSIGEGGAGLENGMEIQGDQGDSGYYDDSFRRIDQESSLRICFGNKNLLFFLVTMCCLTIGSIADNPQIFLQPIHPFMLKSQLCYLPTSQKLNTFNSYRYFKPKKQLQWNDIHLKQTSIPPILDQDVFKISDIFDIDAILSKINPKGFEFMPNLKDPSQMLMGMGLQQVLRRFLDGRNYYV